MKKSVHHIPDFTVLFWGRLLASMSLQTQAVIVGWYVYELTHDPLLLGLIGLAEALPAIGFAFLSGHVVDSRKPASVYRVCVWMLVVNALIIWLSVWPGLGITAGFRLLILFSAVFVSGMVRSFTSPSVFALIAHIVPREHLSQAAAWNSSAFQLAAICGPAIGGIVYGALGPAVAFSIPPFFNGTRALQLALVF